MKTILTAPAMALLFVLTRACAFGQDITLDSGFTQQSLLTIQVAQADFDFDSSGNLYYFGAPDSNPADAQIVEATEASDFTTDTTLVDYGTATYQAFLKVHGATLYYGDSAGNYGNVNSTALPVSSPPASPTVIANMPGNYDLAFSSTTATVPNPSNTAFVSADIQGASAVLPENEIDSLNVTTGSTEKILDCGGDYSGPIAFDASGDLLYGLSGSNTNSKLFGIYLFTAAQVKNAYTSGTALQISNGRQIIENSMNADFAVVGNLLYQSLNFDPSGASTLTLYNLTTFASTPIGSAPEDYYFSSIRALDGNLVVGETDGDSVTNFIEITEVPEPGAVWLGAAGLLIVLYRRRNHAKA